jgi:hypothetical protein
MYVRRSEGMPDDRLASICDEMHLAYSNSDESRGDEKIIILIHDEDSAGALFHGYEDEKEALAEVLIHAQQLAKTSGGDIRFFAMPVNQG